MTRGWVLLFAALLVVGTTLVGTTGFTSASMDRSVEVAVVEDEYAFLGYEQAVETSNNTTELTVTVTNQVPGDLTLDQVTVRVHEDPPGFEGDPPGLEGDPPGLDADSPGVVVEQLGRLDSGRSATATVTGVDDGDEIIVTATSEAVKVRLFRSVDGDS
jgi:hypothetical protein